MIIKNSWREKKGVPNATRGRAGRTPGEGDLSRIHHYEFKFEKTKTKILSGSYGSVWRVYCGKGEVDLGFLGMAVSTTIQGYPCKHRQARQTDCLISLLL